MFKTVEAYLRAFTGRDRVLLIVKTSPRDRTATTAEDRPPRARRGRRAWSLARLIAEPPGSAGGAGWLPAPSPMPRSPPCTAAATATCRSAAVRAGGSGAFDAAAHGNPVVTTGVRRPPRLSRRLALPGRLRPRPGRRSRWVSQLRTATSAGPSRTSSTASALLRQVAAGSATAVGSGAALAEDIRWRYRPAAIASAFRSTVAKHRHDSGDLLSRVS